MSGSFRESTKGVVRIDRSANGSRSAIALGACLVDGVLTVLEQHSVGDVHGLRTGVNAWSDPLKTPDVELSKGEGLDQLCDCRAIDCDMNLTDRDDCVYRHVLQSSHLLERSKSLLGGQLVDGVSDVALDALIQVRVVPVMHVLDPAVLQPKRKAKSQSKLRLNFCGDCTDVEPFLGGEQGLDAVRSHEADGANLLDELSGREKEVDRSGWGI